MSSFRLCIFLSLCSYIHVEERKGEYSPSPCRLESPEPSGTFPLTDGPTPTRTTRNIKVGVVVGLYCIVELSIMNWKRSFVHLVWFLDPRSGTLTTKRSCPCKRGIDSKGKFRGIPERHPSGPSPVV